VRGHPLRYWFKPSGSRNEALDRRVYALAALHARPVDGDRRPQLRQMEDIAPDLN
jgi:phage terminase large subunit GpA-like protein